MAQDFLEKVKLAIYLMTISSGFNVSYVVFYNNIIAVFRPPLQGPPAPWLRPDAGRVYTSPSRA